MNPSLLTMIVDIVLQYLVCSPRITLYACMISVFKKTGGCNFFAPALGRPISYMVLGNTEIDYMISTSPDNLALIV